jgi:hypothetical protein
MNTSLTTGNLTYGPGGQNKGAVLTAGNYLRVGDYLYAKLPGRYAYFAVLQANGDLRSYYSELNDFNAVDTDQPYYSLVCDSPGPHVDPSWHFDPNQNGQYFAIMQTDGNFVIYRGTGPSDNHGPCWATNTWQQGTGPSYAAVLSSDGNLQVGTVVPGSVPTSDYPGLNVTWQSGLSYPGQRIRSGNCLQAGQWMTQDSNLYSANLAYAAGLQQTGAITLSYAKPPGRALVDHSGQAVNPAQQYWTNNVAQPAGPCFVIMQTDGNLAIYKGTDPAHNLGFYWAISGTARPVGSYVTTITNDGTLAVYAGTDPNSTTTPLWTHAAPANPLDYRPSIVSGNNQELHVSLGGWYPVAPLAVQLIRANGVPCPRDTVYFLLYAAPEDGDITFETRTDDTQPVTTQQAFPTDEWGVATINTCSVYVGTPGAWQFYISACAGSFGSDPQVMLHIEVVYQPLSPSWSTFASSAKVWSRTRGRKGSVARLNSSTIAFELLTLAWIRWRFFGTGFVRSFVSIAIGGAIIASGSAALGAAG